MLHWNEDRSSGEGLFSLGAVICWRGGGVFRKRLVERGGGA